jgi:hypothetical protein
MAAGKCGLPKGTTLADFIEAELGMPNPKAVKDFTEEMVLGWVKKFINEYKRRPTVNDGVIEFAEGLFSGMTWRLLNNHLHRGGRGFNKGGSLYKLIKQKKLWTGS